MTTGQIPPCAGKFNPLGIPVGGDGRQHLGNPEDRSDRKREKRTVP